MAVNSALALLQMAAENGVIPAYDNAGIAQESAPYTPTSEIVKGSDCSALVSWCIDKALVNYEDGVYTGGYEWRTVEEFYNTGTKIESENWDQVQPGDVFTTKYNRRHTGIIIYNDPENECFITAEAAGEGIGIVLKTRTYKDLRENGYKINDMTEIYDRTVDIDKNLDGNDDYVRDF